MAQETLVNREPTGTGTLLETLSRLTRGGSRSFYHAKHGQGRLISTQEASTDSTLQSLNISKEKIR